MKCPKCGKGKVKAACTVVTVYDISTVALTESSLQIPGYKVNVVNDSECVEEESRTLFCEACGHQWTPKELYLDTLHISPKMSSEYIRNPFYCPFCGERGITLDKVSEDDSLVNGSAKWQAQCRVCNRVWNECYQLTHIEDI